jgi:hypothetical protein
MKRYLILFLLPFYVCLKGYSTDSLHIEKVYIVEYNFVDNYQKDGFKFNVVGFGELNKTFNLTVAFESFADNYCLSDYILPDTIRQMVVNIINRYQSDTAFVYQGNNRIYDGNAYCFIFYKSGNIYTKVSFEPKYLPEDLLFLYQQLYEQHCEKIKNKSLQKLFSEFENIIMTGDTLPFPKFKKTIQFAPPIFFNEIRE